MREKTDAIQSILEGALPEEGPGCSAAVVLNGEILFRRDYGLANINENRKIDKKTVFHCASISKQFTAALVHLLEIEGLLSVKDRIVKYIPELPSPYSEVTIDHLIHHTSGIRDQWELLPLRGWNQSDPLSNREILEVLIRQKDLNFPPGSEYLYCTSGYTLLAIALERITGNSFARLSKERIFNPLEMKDTCFSDGDDCQKQNILSNLALSYIATANDGYKEVPLHFTTVGGTGLKTTVSDLIRWTEEWRKRETLPSELFDRMIVPGTLNDGTELQYGSGLLFRELEGYRAYGHGGIDAGYRSYIITYPRLELSIIILANTGSMVPGGLVERIARLYIGNTTAEAEEKAAPSVIPVPEMILSERSGLYFSDKTAVARKLEIKENRLQIRLGNGLPLEGIGERAMQICGRPYATYDFSEEGLTETIGSGAPVFYRKCETFNPEIKDLEKYTGSFYCDDIGETFRITLVGRTLHLTGDCIKARKLDPLGIHSFIAEITADLDSLINLNITFHKERRNVQGFLLNTRDIRNLRFIRIEE